MQYNPCIFYQTVIVVEEQRRVNLSTPPPIAKNDVTCVNAMNHIVPADTVFASIKAN
jgi:hypothetical protein